MVASLVAILVSILAELSRGRGRRIVEIALPAAGCLAIVAWPGAGLAWLPLVAYDLFTATAPAADAATGVPQPWRRLCGVVPVAALLGCLGRVSGRTALLVVLLGAVVGVLAWRTARSAALIEAYRERRDHLTETSRRLKTLNAGLEERQELEVRLATADERSRIAREIHDNAGHLLTRSLLQTQALMVADPATADRLAPLAATLGEAMDTIRDSVHGLRDEAIDLEAALAALAAGTRLKLTVDQQAGDLPPAVGRAFLAIARESVANTLRHSDATTLRIAVTERPGLFRLVVDDDGSAPPSRGDGLGMGLAAIEERARALGGISRTSYDRGFRVFVSVPKPHPSEATADADGAASSAVAPELATEVAPDPDAAAEGLGRHAPTRKGQ
ncbi:MAG: histidine kinase [Bifidobacteriaceae bacterium]|nr:histidine kinase [Bifidobacteriaceae bacterium]